MSLYFRPEKAVLGDVIPYYDNGVFKPFYLRNYRANRDEQHQDSWVTVSYTHLLCRLMKFLIALKLGFQMFF